MKRLICLSVILFLFFSFGVSWAADCEECQQVLSLLPKPSFTACQDPALTPREKLQCVMGNYCQAMWIIQPLMQYALIPLIAGLIDPSQACVSYAFWRDIDAGFWIPLVCYCNHDVLSCITCTGDFLFNTDMYNSNCR